MYPIVYFDALQLKIRDEGTVKNKAVYPAAQIQTCIVHLIRNSLKLASWKEWLPRSSRSIRPPRPRRRQRRSTLWHSEWGHKFPTVAAMWQRQWEQVIPFFAYPPQVRRIVYTNGLPTRSAPRCPCPGWSYHTPKTSRREHAGHRFIMPVTNAIESMHMQLRKIVKNRGHFPSDEAVSKLLYLALRNIEKDWKMPPITWQQAAN
ncbi:transposase [Mycetohabitans rhizoxinica]|uniref:transposase n=1 Tax=Mycetohabitans rhizoxinica TaxID=412963 RepID=UPI0030CF9877